MSKRGNGEGSITKRKDGRWMGRVTVLGSGRRTVYGKTRKEVADEIGKLHGDIRQGLPLGDKTTVGAFLNRWLEDCARPSVRPNTYECYEYLIRQHIEPTLGSILLHKLMPSDLQRLYIEKLKAGRLVSRTNQKGLSPATVTRMHAVLHRALTQAARWGLVPRNVAALVDRPKQRRHEIQSLTPDQARAFLEEARGTRLEALFILALTTGMRQGELLGLRWRDLDLDARRLSVRQTARTNAGQATFGEPKSDRAKRSITLTAMGVAALRVHRARQAEERLAAGPAWTDFDLVFCSTTGTPLRASNLTRRDFRPLLKEAGLPLIRFHDLRHSAATLLLSRNVHPKKVQELLGHSQISLTMDTYSHLLPGMHDEAAEQMDLLLGVG